MRKLHLAVLAFAAITSSLAFAGESPQPTFRLGDGATPLGYKATLAIDPDAEGFEGEVTVRFMVNHEAPRVWLNALQLTIEAAELRQDDRVVPVKVVPGGSDFVALEAQEGTLAAGETVARLRYRGKLEPNDTRGLFRQREAGDWYVVSQFEDDHARRAFPCFDEPSWKAPWQLTIDAPAANVVVSNTPEQSAADAPGRPGWKRHVFAPTPPLPTYLVALAVGPFDVVDGGTAGSKKIPLRYLAMRGRGAELRYAKQVTPRIVELLEEYFGMPYPFEKLDTVPIAQTVGFGAMENAGMITYASTLTHARPDEETPTFRRLYAAIAAHEIAHMGFGDLVTPAWWDDIWLNEAFATWMSRKVMREFEPSWDNGWQRTFGRGRALLADSLPSARRIHNPIVVHDDINLAFDRITYDKGGEVLSMFEAWLGEDRFRQGVRNYMKKYSWGNATSRDFFAQIGAAAGKSEAALAAFDGFVDQPGIPLIDATLECGKGRAPALHLTQQRLSPAGAQLPAMRWTTPACFTLPQGKGTARRCIEVSEGGATLALGEPGACPAWVTGNAGGGGHYVVRPDSRLQARLTASLPAMPQYEAAALVQNASLLSRIGLMRPVTALAIFRRALAHPALSVQRSAIEGLRVMHPEHVVGEAVQAKARLDREVVVPLARRVGWDEAASDSDEKRELRVLLLPYAARTDAGAPLRARARAKALAWARDRKTLEAMMVAPVLETAARFADAATYDRIEAVALSTKDLRERKEVLGALATVRDPALRSRALARSVERNGAGETMAGRDALAFVEEALRDDANRVAAFAFVREHFDALAAKVPALMAGEFERALERLCTPGERANFATFFEPRAPALRGGAKRFRLTLESIDTCVAATPAS
jgi:alanyl aminopeptidase